MVRQTKSINSVDEVARVAALRTKAELILELLGVVGVADRLMPGSVLFGGVLYGTLERHRLKWPNGLGGLSGHAKYRSGGNLLAGETAQMVTNYIPATKYRKWPVLRA